MNKHIQALAAECGFKSNPDPYDRNQHFDIEKFAKLVAIECVQIVENTALGYHQPTWAFELVGDIKQHFGIPE